MVVTRFLNDMKAVLADQAWAETAPNFELYYMHRGVKKQDGLRYDVTVIPPRMLGREFVKTKGHEHAKKYGELYIVLKGEATYLMQRFEDNQIKDVYAVMAKKGDVVIIPPYYGHITINPSKKEELKEANWVDETCQNVYDLFIKKQGACYYYTNRGWIKNKNYSRVPKLRFQRPLKKIPENLDFLHGD